jgi:hypothetical protein
VAGQCGQGGKIGIERGDILRVLEHGVNVRNTIVVDGDWED